MGGHEEKEMTLTRGTLLSVNVGGIREFKFGDRVVVSAIWKAPVTGRVAARGVNLEGDDQADRAAHGGPDKAVYAYATEDLRWWKRELGRPLECGELGENLTTEGIDVNGALIGERWEIGSTVVEVSEPRVPCWRLGVRMEDKLFPRRFTKAGRPGAYLRIAVEGDVGAGDEIRVVGRPDHDLTVGDVFRIYTRDRDEVARLLSVPQISSSWKRWAEVRMEKSERRRAEDHPAAVVARAAKGNSLDHSVVPAWLYSRNVCSASRRSPPHLPTLSAYHP